MTTMEEDYVSFETAKLLKEKGFEGENRDWYNMEGFIEEIGVDDGIDPTAHEDIFNNAIPAPTLQMAIKWLRKKHNLAVSTSITVDGWRSSVSQIKLDSEGFVVDIIDGIDNGNIPNHDTYEEACEAAIKYCLENLV